MIIDFITLSNYGPYYGTQKIDLSPVSQDKPVVLFGALNGSGKTTLLDGMQLALYGSRANCYDNKSSFSKYLKEKINDHSAQVAKTFVELQFRHYSEGKEDIYKIKRSWKLNKENKLLQTIEVWNNNKPDSLLADTWNDFIEGVIPASIAHLFFFDGEKIEDFAELKNAQKLLKIAINSLLGVDIIEQLNSDLLALERKKKTNLKNDSERQAIEVAQKNVERLEKEKEVLVSRKAKLQNEFQRAEYLLSKLNDKFNKEGGDLYLKQKEIDKEKITLENRLGEVNKYLISIASTSSPFIMVDNLLNNLLEQVNVEINISEAKLLNSKLEKRDSKILEMLKQLKNESPVSKNIEDFLTEDRASTKEQASGELFLNCPADTNNQLKQLKNELPVVEDKYSTYAELANNLQDKLDLIERKISAIPNYDMIAPIIEDKKKQEQNVEELKYQLKVLEDETSRKYNDLEHKKSTLFNQIEIDLNKQFERNDDFRIIEYSEKNRAVLEIFHKKLIDKHISHIQTLILDSFSKLLRKKALVNSIKISKKDFSLKLFGTAGTEIDPNRLSAGERQLLAVSMLWGLARAAGRPLPAIIDTPLGRLDSKHRINLIKHYYPYASHQVLILSTDEEIDAKYYKELKPYIGREYTLEYDEIQKGTIVKNQYAFA